MAAMNYQITLNEEQARITMLALEIYSRIGMGQLQTITEHPDVFSRVRQQPRVQSETVRVELQQIKRVIFPELDPVGMYHSISSPEISDSNRVAYEILQVIRHRLSWDAAGNAPTRTSDMIGVIYDAPRKTSKQPLPTIVPVEG